MLTPKEMTDALDRRYNALTVATDGYDAALDAQAEAGLPRITALETEYLRTVTAAEAQWVRSVADDLRAGRLAWSAEMLTALADAQDNGS